MRATNDVWERANPAEAYGAKAAQQEPRRAVPRIGVAIFLLLLAGCGKASGPATVPVTGTVTLNGSPVEGAMVIFSPAGADDPHVGSQSETDRDGKFRLRTHVGGGRFKDGVVPGAYVVAISKLDTAASKTTYAPPKNVLPTRYADGKTSQFKAEVTVGGKNDFEFAMHGG